MTATEHMESLRIESERLKGMNAAYDRMVKAALAKDNDAFKRARQEFWNYAPQRVDKES